MNRIFEIRRRGILGKPSLLGLKSLRLLNVRSLLANIAGKKRFSRSSRQKRILCSIMCCMVTTLHVNIA